MCKFTFKRYVAVIDILGFKELLKHNSVEDIVKIVDSLVSHVREFKSYWGYSNISLEGSERLAEGVFKFNEMHFSDTIFLWTDPLNPCGNHFERSVSGQFISSVANLIGNALISGVPLRAGVSYGECFIDMEKHICVGQAIVDAHSTESYQNWIGGALHPSCVTPEEPVHNTHLVTYSVPVKPGATFQISRAIDWRRSISDDKSVDSINNYFNQHISSDLPASIKEKYQNSKVFFDTKSQVIREQ